MNEIKIYRVEIWCATDNRYKWAWHELSDFYTNKELAEKRLQELLTAYKGLETKYFVNKDNDVNKLFDKWAEYIGELIEDNVWDTRGNMPEIREYTLKQ